MHADLQAFRQARVLSQVIQPPGPGLRQAHEISVKADCKWLTAQPFLFANAQLAIGNRIWTGNG